MLRESILKALAGTTPENAVLLDTLRKIAAPLVEDMQQLYDLLEELYSARTVNRVSGCKDGKSYMAYWETGSVTPSMPCRIKPPSDEPQPALGRKIATPQEAAAKMQTSAKPAAPVKLHKEVSMVQRGKGAMRLAIHQFVKDTPGTGSKGITEFALKKFPDTTKPKIMATIGNLVTDKSIRAEGPRQARIYFDKDVAGAPAAAGAATAAPATRRKKGEKFQAKFGMDGTLSISQGNKRFELDRDETQQFIRFITHQQTLTAL
ncbi:hypothetical protein GALL_71730 [mine drainage metagenome]|uniref:Uncharacterized protein n=1 Tax=mine drainage metagenome TaxID=410659 RepID=A0A1J5SR54_9ZZZZ